MPGNFFDTNVLVYIASDEPMKAGRAEALLAEEGTISVQVLNEIINFARREMRLSWIEVYEFLNYVRRLLVVVPLTVLIV